MKIPLLSDLTHQISKDYGVYLEDQGHTLRCGFPHLQTLQELFSFLRGFNGLEMLNLVSECLRGLFIIDEKGVLRQITMNDLPVGRSVDETLRLVQAFQYTDKHGEGTGNKCGMG